MEEEHLRDLASEAAGSVNDATVMEDNTHTHTHVLRLNGILPTFDSMIPCQESPSK